MHINRLIVIRKICEVYVKYMAHFAIAKDKQVNKR